MGRKLSELVRRPIRTEQELAACVESAMGLRVPQVAVCAGHHPPMEYLWRAYAEPAGDLVVWAPRGGGKTRLGALATLLDLLRKPGCSVAILGGSLEQSLRMWEHLLPDVQEAIGSKLVKGRVRGRQILLESGSRASVLTQSQRSVRGLRVQKLRCDEVEMFDRDVWEAAQLVTQSRPGLAPRRQQSSDGRRPVSSGKSAGQIRGAVEAISTLHQPAGLMSELVERAVRDGIPLIRWCLLEVLQRCPEDRQCKSCPLEEDCQGRAKTLCNGFVAIEDAIAMKQRVSRQTWECEMLCRQPSLREAVFPHFDPQIHVQESLGPELQAGQGDLWLGIDFGFASPFVCLWIIRGRDDVSHVVDEYVQEQRMMHEHLEQIRLRPWGRPRFAACDPSGQTRNDQTARSNVELLRGLGCPVRCRHSPIVEGLEMIRRALKPAWGQPKLFIHPRCGRLIAAMKGYRYGKGGGELPLKDGRHDHLVDALRYYFANRQGEAVVARKY